MYNEINRTIALIEPGSSFEAEKEFHEYGNEKVSILTTRIPFDSLTSKGLSMMLEKLPFAIESIAGGRPRIIVINSFTGSCLRGYEMINTVEQLLGVPVIVPAIEMIKYLKKINAKSVALISAFGKEFNMLEKIFFESQNVEVSKIINVRTNGNPFEDDDPYLISRISPMTIIEKIKEADLKEIDAILLDSPTFILKRMIDNFDKFIDIPIFTTNQILLYSAFKHVGVSVDNLIISKYLDGDS